MKFDEIYDVIGGIGPYQFIHFIILGITPLMSVETIYLNFMGAPMDHWCKVDSLQDLPFEQQKIIAIPDEMDDDEVTFSECEMFNHNYSTMNYTLEELMNWNRWEHNDTEIIDCTNGWVFDRDEFSETIQSEWDLVCNDSWQVDMVSTLHLLGFLFGSIIAGSMSDRYGRKPSLLAFLVVKVIGCWASTFAPSYGFLLGARFICGMGSMGFYIISFVIVVESVGPQYRSHFGVAYSILFAIGFMLVPGFAYAIRDWVKVQVIMAAPTTLLFLYIFILPESPRWLVLKGHHEKADRIIRYIAKINNRTLPADFDIKDIEVEKDDNKTEASILDLLRTPRIRWYTFLQATIWFTDSLLYYALSLNAGSLAGDIFLNTFLLGLVEVPACLLAMYLMNVPAFGRRHTNGWALVIAGVASLVCVPLIMIDEESVAVTVLAMVGKAGSAASFNGMYVFTSEIYPTEVRNAGLGFCSMAARISGTAAPYVGGTLGDVWAPLPSLIFGVLGTVSGFMTFLLPETFLKVLPETVAELEHAPKTSRRGGAKVEPSSVDNNNTMQMTK